ncbi:MAG TPA: hypothetical protein VKT82_29020 [Ktedonobacterales bacterium]|nr:hypothetical protein [Ktedonobacterales bacterium]
MFRLLQQQRYPWAPGSFVLTVALLAILGWLLPAPDNSGHFSGGILTIELGIIALLAALVVAILALIRQPQTSPFARSPSTRFTRARLLRAVARASVPLGVGAALLCQGVGRSLVQSDASATPPELGVALLLLAQIWFFGGFALGVFLRPFALARVTRPLQRTLLWLLVVLEWVALFAAATLADGLGQQGKQTIIWALPSLLFVDITALTLVIGSILLFRRALTRAEQDLGGPITRSDWPRLFWDAGSAKICLYGLALAVLGLGALPWLDLPDPLWISELCACLALVLGAAIAPSPAPAISPTLAAVDGTARMAGHA